MVIDCVAAWVVRTLAITAMRIPMKPADQRTERANQKANGRRAIFENKEQNENDHRDRADRDHLTIQIRLGALLDGPRDFSHPLVCLPATEPPRRSIRNADDETDHRADHGRAARREGC